MIKIIEINTRHKHYPFLETLLHSAFPEVERRDTSEQRKNSDCHPLFHSNLIMDNEKPVGLLTYWDFDSFIYIEHFAIDGQLRNKGYGQQALSLLKGQVQRSIVLEAEEPSDELTARRIGFYQRQGFVLQNTPYLQPPYHSGDGWLPMKLMIYGMADHIPTSKIIDTIHREVYGISHT